MEPLLQIVECFFLLLNKLLHEVPLDVARRGHGGVPLLVLFQRRYFAKSLVQVLIFRLEIRVYLVLLPTLQPKVLRPNLKLFPQLEIALLRRLVIKSALTLICATLINLSSPINLTERLLLELAVDFNFKGQPLLQIGFLFSQKQIVSL